MRIVETQTSLTHARPLLYLALEDGSSGRNAERNRNVHAAKEKGDMLLRYAILSLLDGEEMHGYRIKSAFEQRLGALWPANFGQIYASLKHLRRRGLITGRLETGTGHLNRWTYTITAKGRRALATWLNRAPRRPEFVRDEIFIRLLGTIREPEASLAQLMSQERVYGTYLVELDRRRRSLAHQSCVESLERLVLDAMVLQVETRLRWLQQCGVLLRQRSSPDEPPPPLGGAHP